MKVVIAADHGGFPLKQALVERLTAEGYDVLDLGAHEYAATDDYPDFAFAVAQAVANGNDTRGVVVCGSGKYLQIWEKGDYEGRALDGRSFAKSLRRLRRGQGNGA